MSSALEEFMHRLEHLRNLVQQDDAEGFAKAMKLDPAQTRQWFDQGFTEEGYGADVIRTLGTHVLKALTSGNREGDAHGGAR
jgi:hypothetical protein